MHSYNGPLWHQRVKKKEFKKKKKVQKPVSFKFCKWTRYQYLLSSEVRLGLLLSALKRRKLAKFPRTEPKPLEKEVFILNQKNCRSASKKKKKEKKKKKGRKSILTLSDMWISVVYEHLKTTTTTTKQLSGKGNNVYRNNTPQRAMLRAAKELSDWVGGYSMSHYKHYKCVCMI